MNWAGSLGVSPGLLVLETPRTLVAITLDRMPPILVIPERAQLPRKPRKVRTRAESAASRARIILMLQRGDERALIAEREDVTPAWVDAIARTIGKSYRRMTSEALAEVAAKARRLYAADPHMKTKEVAAACGVSSSNLCNILRRYP